MLIVEKKWKGAGGTPGGIGHFIIGCIMAIVGCYLLLNQVIVHSGFWSFFSGSSFGIVLIPFLMGVGILFYNGRSIVGWFLTAAGFLVIVTGIVANMHIFFMPTSLFNTLVMLVLLVGGVVLVVRSLHAFPEV